ncbi:MAG: LysM peptidoglycan-binding domain-containing protein [Gammaproteobacteria bacterium]|nr:LysM peptidoglycan-binding domain-containing protein [Gammaproteobacteria bacterium]
MVSNQVLGARAAAGLLIVSVLLGACSHAQRSSSSPPTMASSSAGAPAAESSAAPEEMTATEAAISASAAPPAAPTEAAPAVNPTAPMHYTVKRGDTLWGIASMYLKDPWHWPEVWVINPQIPNPHLIYPGDQLALAYGADGRPQVSVEQAGAVRMDPRLRSSALDNAIPAIPYATIAAFLSRPTVMTSDDVRQAPYVLAFRDLHEVAGAGNEVYVRNYGGNANSRYAVVHVATPLRDPDDGKVVGYEAIYTATALMQRSGNPAKAVLIDSARETLRGDRLLATDNSETPVNFTPRAPATDVHGRIIDVVGGTDLVGQYEVVVLNRGKSQGVDAGSVLAIDQAGDVVADIYHGGRSIGSLASHTFAPKVRLPDERTGTLLVFKSFDRVSYGLILVANDTIHVGDRVHNP